MEVQLQSHNVACLCAVWLRNPGRTKNCALATDGNFGTNDEAPIQGNFYIRRNKSAGILVDSHMFAT
jgi:hypothetical protein